MSSRLYIINGRSAVSILFGKASIFSPTLPPKRSVLVLLLAMLNGLLKQPSEILDGKFAKSVIHLLILLSVAFFAHNSTQSRPCFPTSQSNVEIQPGYQGELKPSTMVTLCYH